MSVTVIWQATIKVPSYAMVFGFCIELKIGSLRNGRYVTVTMGAVPVTSYL